MDSLSIDALALPDITKPEMDFIESSFFQSSDCQMPRLPSPASIIQQYGNQGHVVIIEHLVLAVKIGYADRVRLEEVQAMRAIRQVFLHYEIPIPKVFGWRTHGQQLFMYMSLVQGITLFQAWPFLTPDDMTSIQRDLRRVTSLLRQIVQLEPENICMSESSREWHQNLC